MHTTLTDKEIIETFTTFDQDKKSLVLSTTSQDNEPLTNYSPFVKRGSDYYIAVSSNLPHCINMLQTQKAHVLIIEDEAKANNIYARKRLYFSVACEEVTDTTEIFNLFDERYGEELSFLREMKDFKVIKLTHSERSLVLGFGAAYKMNVDGSLASKSIQHK